VSQIHQFKAPKAVLPRSTPYFFPQKSKV